GFAAALLLLAGGLGALQAATLVAALPFAVIMIALAAGLIRQMNADVAGIALDATSPPLSEQIRRIFLATKRSEVERQIEDPGLMALQTVCEALVAEGIETVRAGRDEGGAALCVRQAD